MIYIEQPERMSGGVLLRYAVKLRASAAAHLLISNIGFVIGDDGLERAKGIEPSS